MANGFPGPGPLRFAPLLAFLVVGIGGFYFASARRPSPAPRVAPPAAGGLAMAICKGSVKESPDDEFWKIPLDQCDKAIDAIDVQSGFVTQWKVCGGAKSFELSLNPRALIVSSDHIHCSQTPSEASVTFVGTLKK